MDADFDISGFGPSKSLGSQLTSCQSRHLCLAKKVCPLTHHAQHAETNTPPSHSLFVCAEQPKQYIIISAETEQIFVQHLFSNCVLHLDAC